MTRDTLCSTLCDHAASVDSSIFHPKASYRGSIQQQGILQVHIEKAAIKPITVEKTTIDVLGICCPAEVPLVKKLLEPLPGVEEVLVNVTTKTVTVRHDPALTSPEWIVKVLNDARLDASIHHRGEWKAGHKWPSPYTVASGFMVALSFFQYLYGPLRWAGLGAVALGMPPIAMKGLVSLRRFILDINVLMIIAVSGAIGLGDYLEAGSIVFLFTLADWLESRSSDKARMAITYMANLAPQHAVLSDDGQKVLAADVKVGSRILVKAGDLVPIDGVVVSGKSTVDESGLTGEPLPVEKVGGDTVWAGTLNLTGYLYVETTALAEDSVVARMIRLVEEAQTQRSHMERVIEKFAKYYTPVILIAAIATAIIPLIMHAQHTRHWLYLALVLLVAACPCALVISTPVTTTCAIAQAARMGLIIKGGSFLEALGKLKVIAIDKTGTLTEGRFQVKEIRLLNEDVNLRDLLYWIASVENNSSHPMASSFVAYAKLHGVLPSADVKDFTILPGEGVSGVVNGHVIHIGNERLARRLRWTDSEPAILDTWKLEGWTVTWVFIDGQPRGLLCAGDCLRSEAKEAIDDLKRIGIQIALLTGDCQAAAEMIQKKVGEIDVYAQLLPEGKVEVLKRLKKLGMTGMVGDGTNDAPALASADVGIAMGVAGSAIAMEAADISLMTNDLRQLSAAVKLGRKAFRKILQNVFVSLCTKVLIIVLAALGYASLWGAVLADAGTCLLVIANGMLLLGRGKVEKEIYSHHDKIDHNHHHHHHHESHDHHSHHHCHSHHHKRIELMPCLPGSCFLCLPGSCKSMEENKHDDDNRDESDDNSQENHMEDRVCCHSKQSHIIHSHNSHGCQHSKRMENHMEDRVCCHSKQSHISHSHNSHGCQHSKRRMACLQARSYVENERILGLHVSVKNKKECCRGDNDCEGKKGIPNACSDFSTQISSDKKRSRESVAHANRCGKEYPSCFSEKQYSPVAQQYPVSSSSKHGTSADELLCAQYCSPTLSHGAD